MAYLFTFQKKRTFSFFVIASTLVSNSAFAASEDLDALRPHEMICSITATVMQDPVVAAEGYSYERTAIQEWSRRSGGKSPNTGLPFEHQYLISNHALKALIREWTPGRQRVVSPFNQLEASVILERVESEFNAHKELLHCSRGREIVAFLGNKGSGKSTLINQLLGKELIEDQYGQGFILAHPEDPTALPIGSTGEAQTLYPKSIQVDDVLFFDIPGCDNTDGSARNLVSSAFVRQILTEAASVRFVFVAGEDEFTALRGEPVRDMFEALRLLLLNHTEQAEVISNAIFVVTKSTCCTQKDLITCVLNKSSGERKAALKTQLDFWAHSDRLFGMPSPLMKIDWTGERNRILESIRQAPASRILDINASVLYPPEIKKDFVHMFFEAMQKELFNERVRDLCDCDQQLTLYRSEDSWQEAELFIRYLSGAAGLIKELCINSYQQAKTKVIKDYETIRQTIIQRLVAERQKRVQQLEQRTQQKLEELDKLMDFFVSSKHVASEIDCMIEFYNVERSALIESNHSVEKEIVRQYCARHISRHQRFIEPQHPEELESWIAAIDLFVAENGGATGEDNPVPLYKSLTVQVRDTPYDRFMRGSLIYRPTWGSDVGEIILPIASLTNPLEGVFDLSNCGDTAGYCQISTGYRKGKVAKNRGKTEIWIVPKFVVEQDINGSACHFQPIIHEWSAPVGIFITYGAWDNLGWYDYNVTQPVEKLAQNLSNLRHIVYRNGYQPSDRGTDADYGFYPAHYSQFRLSFTE